MWRWSDGIRVAVGYAMVFFALGSALTVHMHETRTNLPQYFTKEIGETEFEELLSRSALEGLKWHVEQFADGSKCYIPEAGQQLAPVTDGVLERGMELVEEATIGVSMEMQPFEHYWRYKFINTEFNKTVIQYNENHKVVLGSMAKADPQSVRRTLERDEDSYYISEKFSNGDMCLFLGENRTLDVQYRCQYDTPVDFIRSTKEYEICRYTLVVSIPSLCEIPIFGPHARQSPANTIYCTPATTPKLDAVTLIESYKPTFLGFGFYHLSPYPNWTHHDTTAILMYHQEPLTGQSETISKTDATFFEHLSYACLQLVDMGLLKDSAGKPFTVENNFTWYAKIIGFEGELIEATGLRLRDGKLLIYNVDPELLGEMEEGNLNDYERQVPEDVSNENLKPSGPLDDPAIVQMHIHEFRSDEDDTVEEQYDDYSNLIYEQLGAQGIFPENDGNPLFHPF
ncbi:AaceriAER171Wp [[Ashbya] aceris (nom. inval.)]|nr:AaceriAER171Wp [[Ashbya] aceris (nom. inval.)]